MKSIHYLTPFFNFLVAVLLGMLLRAIYVYPIAGVNFLYILHAHSHIAMLGWVYLILYVLLVRIYALETKEEYRFYNRLFWVTQISVIGMLCTFPFQGYAMGSILFSTLHIFCSYFFVYRLWKKNKVQRPFEKALVHTALVFMVLSTFGVWLMGPAVGLMGKASTFYQVAIQFFLHFQFNGWFLIAVLVVFLHYVFKDFNPNRFKLFYGLLLASVVLSFSFPMSWHIDGWGLQLMSSIGMCLQLGAFGSFVYFNRGVFIYLWKTQTTIEKLVLGFSLFSLALRLGMQVLTLIPVLTEQAHLIRHWTVGFIHLNMLGIITGLLIWVLMRMQVIPVTLVSTWATLCFVLSYFLTELTLFIEGSVLFLSVKPFFNSYVLLFWLSIGLPVGILMWLGSLFNLKSSRV